MKGGIQPDRDAYSHEVTTLVSGRKIKILDPSILLIYLPRT